MEPLCRQRRNLTSVSYLAVWRDAVQSATVKVQACMLCQIVFLDRSR